MREAIMQKPNILKTRTQLILAVVLALTSIAVLADSNPSQIENGKNATALIRINVRNKPSSPARGFPILPAPGMPNPGVPMPGTTTPSKPAPAKQPLVNGTAFCIDPAGWFITCKHVTDEASNGKVSLILNAGEKNQRILEAKVVRADKDKDLALLKVAGQGPFVALPLGKIDSLIETLRLTAFGYPFGEALALDENDYPSISVSPGAITSLRKKDGKLEMIQLDASLNPGNSGGPVLDPEGRVVGIVNAGIEGAAVNFAIPVSHLQEFLSLPDVEFIAPALTAENMNKTATFKASLLNVMGSDANFQAELILKAGSVLRKIPMKRDPNGFSAEGVPVPPLKGPVYLSLSASYGESSVSGKVADKSFTAAGKACQLSKVSRLEGGSKPSIIMADGKTIEGAFAGLSSVVVMLDEIQVTLDLAKATSVTVSPVEIIDAVEYQLFVIKGDKHVKTLSGIIPIANVVATPSRAASSGAVSTASSPKISPVQIGEAQTEVKLPSDISDVAVGGGGRFLILHLRRLRQLAIFDVNAAKIVKYLPLDSDNIIFTAGAEKLIVVSVDQSTISRYSLQTFEREVTAQMPVAGTINAIAMGANSRGPLLVVASSGTEQLSPAGFSLVDPNTLALKSTLSKVKNHYQHYRDRVRIRASTDGTVFCMWGTGGSPSGLQTMIIDGNDAQTYYLHDSFAAAIPSPDGRIIYTPSGILNSELAATGSTAALGNGSMRIPAIQGNYYLEIDATGRIGVWLAGEPRALVTLPPVDNFGIAEGFSAGLGAFPPTISPRISGASGNAFFDRDKHIHFIPDARLIIAIPKTNDRLILQQFEPLQALKDAKIDYLFVASPPVISAAKNSNYIYQIQVETKRGNLKFSLENGPAGMKISPTGKLTWLAGPTQGDETVIVRVSDASGQEIFHAFKISVR
jgi:S1-C subfamily serine protease